MKKLFFLISICTSFGLNAQVIANPPTPIILCDVDTPGDLIEVFDLTSREAEIIGGQTNVVVSFHPTSGDALGGQNAFPNPESYLNTANPQLIFVRVRSTVNGDWQVTTMDIEVLPTIETSPQAIYLPDDNQDGFTLFDLTVNEAAMIGTQDPANFSFSYFETELDCETNANPIVTPTAYMNILNPQTMYVRVERFDNGCVFCTSFEIETDGSLGIEDNFGLNVLLYPNPVRNKLTLQWDAAMLVETISVYALNGKLMYIESISKERNSSILNLSGISEGIYFIKVATQKGTFTEKIIKN